MNIFLLNVTNFFQCIQHRALNPDDPLPEVDPLIAEYDDHVQMIFIIQLFCFSVV